MAKREEAFPAPATPTSLTVSAAEPVRMPMEFWSYFQVDHVRTLLPAGRLPKANMTTDELNQWFWSERNKYMPKMIDAGELLSNLQRERAELDSAIRALTRAINKNYGSGSPEAGSSPSESAIKRKGHKWSPAKRAEMSKKLKASWAARKKGQKTPTKG